MKYLYSLLLGLLLTLPAQALEKTKYKTGPKVFSHGDKIKIDEVLSSSAEFRIGDTVTVTGKYSLSSHPKAKLCLFLTATVRNEKETVEDSQVIQVDEGKGTFELSHTLKHEGVLHITFYDESGKPFSGIYFGSKSQMEKIEGWSLDHYKK